MIDQEGLKAKFHVGRVDERDKPGGDKEKARYFVLDYYHDPYAIEALKFYAFICQDDYPMLAADLWLALREAAREKGELNEPTL